MGQANPRKSSSWMNSPKATKKPHSIMKKQATRHFAKRSPSFPK